MKKSFYVIGFICFCLSGCQNITPGVYPDQDMLKKGPGLFTGESGEFTVLSLPKQSGPEDKKRVLKKD